MTLDDVLQELIEQLGSGGDTTVAWEQVRHWPGSAIAAFQKAGWIKPTVAASSVECPACEESCFMPVHVLPARNGRASRAYVACDRHDHAGRVKIAMSRLRQWQITEAQIARWVSGALGLKGKPQRDTATGVFTLGALQGKKQIASLEFHAADPVCLKASGHSLPLRQVVIFKGNLPGIDRGAIVELVDLAPACESKDRYEPSTARREARKLDTQAMHERWQSMYRALKRKHQDKSDVWCSQQIAKTDSAQGRDAETIRKHMKK